MTWYTNQPLYPFGWSELPEEIYVDNRSDFGAVSREAVKYVPERTCRNEATVQRKFKCSECGDVWGKPSVDEFRFCPTCGAKVVSE